MNIMSLTDKEKSVFELIGDKITVDELIQKAVENGMKLKSVNMLLMSLKRKNVISNENSVIKKL